ncbi:MAG TPA: 50S ribosomal protein L28 [Spirochaetes bacterium]|nr:50S ribosomal protein L28 [Spirochaetota bacterium]
MARVCEICGKSTTFGRSYAKRGLARRKKGAGIKITGITNRSFAPNLIKKRIVINGKVKNAKVCTSCLRNGTLVLAK